MSSDMRIRRDRSALSDGSIFGRRRRGIAPWKIVLWLVAMGFLGLTVWQFDRIQPQVLSLVSQSTTATPPFIFYAKAADLAYWRGDLDTAITNYRQAVKQQPQNVDLLYELARMLIYHSYADRRYGSDIDEAVAFSQQAIDAAPNNGRAFTINCFALLTTGTKTEDAVRSCIHAIDLNPNDSEAHAYLSAAYFELLRFDTSLQEATKAVQLNDKSIDAHSNLAVVLRYKGRNDAALEEYKKAAAINPRLEFPYFLLAYFAVGTNNFDIAINSYNQVLSMNNHSVKAMTRLCETYYRMGETNLARNNCENAISLDNGYTTAWKWLGQVLYTRRDYEDAITDFDTCAKQELSNQILPDDRLTECWFLDGLAHYLLGECDKAMPIFNDLLSWTHDQNAIKFANTGINKCAATSADIKTPTPIPPTNTPPSPIQ